MGSDLKKLLEYNGLAINSDLSGIPLNSVCVSADYEFRLKLIRIN